MRRKSGWSTLGGHSDRQGDPEEELFQSAQLVDLNKLHTIMTALSVLSVTPRNFGFAKERRSRVRTAIVSMFAACLMQAAGARRLVLIDQDGSGPGGSNQMAMMVLLQSPQVEVLGITMVTGNAWRDEETEHTLRMLELIGRTDVPVAKGAVFPLVRTEEETRLNTPLVGQVDWLGAWGQGPTTLVETASGVVGVKPANPTIHAPDVVPPMPEGAPHTKAIDEDAVHFLVRQVHAHPHAVTIYAAGPLTNIALALRIDPEFAGLTQGIVIMGGSLNPQPGGGAYCVARALAAHRRDDGGCFDQGDVHGEDGGGDCEVAATGGAIHRCVVTGSLLFVG